jgi:hypothetical protein
VGVGIFGYAEIGVEGKGFFLQQYLQHLGCLFDLKVTKGVQGWTACLFFSLFFFLLCFFFFCYGGLPLVFLLSISLAWGFLAMAEVCLIFDELA